MFIALGFLLDKGLPTYVINPLHTNLYLHEFRLRFHLFWDFHCINFNEKSIIHIVGIHSVSFFQLINPYKSLMKKIIKLNATDKYTGFLKEANIHKTINIYQSLYWIAHNKFCLCLCNAIANQCYLTGNPTICIWCFLYNPTISYTVPKLLYDSPGNSHFWIEYCADA